MACACSSVCAELADLAAIVVHGGTETYGKHSYMNILIASQPKHADLVSTAANESLCCK